MEEKSEQVKDAMTVAVVGCTHAGTFAAKSILAQHPDWDVHVFERNDTLSFLSCGIALWVGNHVSDPRRMFYSSPEELSSLGAHMHMRTDVTSVDLVGKDLSYRSLQTGEEKVLSFDKIVVTTGSKPALPPIPGLAEGLGGGRVLRCKNWDDGKLIKEKMAGAKSVAVVGAGYIGAELAEQVSLMGAKVTLIDGLERALAKNFDEGITSLVEEDYRSHGVELALGQMVEGIEADEEGVTVTSGGVRRRVEYLIMAAGFLPRTDLFSGKLDMLPNGAIKVDPYMRATLLDEKGEPCGEPSQDVLAAGDSATVLYNPTGKADYIPLATNAVRQGLLVGANIVCPTQAYLGTQASSAVQLYDLSLAACGLTVAGGKARGIELASTTLVQDFRPDFMLTTEPVTCILTWDPQTREVKGAQFACRHDVSQAANAVSIAIHNHNTIDQLASFDFFFQPNFCQPVNYLGAVAMKAVAENPVA
ncbi:FAD-dependent oxidoreductase [Olsenella urininfantis]|uniref:FAD-dependent oxidoreductase n=1 Tax=Olsenella urininfantis TaxID=1871033 RepID=UPI000BE7AE74|nr:FAD-dependent oxidoreductase [Olsenella urininfantis]